MKTAHNQITALFVICLVIGIPFFSAQSLAAAISITQNEGQAGIEGFVIPGDIWSVQATLIGTDTAVDTSNVALISGNSADSFDDCEVGVGGVVCSKISKVPDPSNVDQFTFHVKYSTIDDFGSPVVLESAEATVSIDSSKPSITFEEGSVTQDSAGKVHLDFSITDISDSSQAGGLGTIEIIANNGTVVEKLDAAGAASYDFKTDAGTNGILTGQLVGEGKQILKIKVTDTVGHSIISEPVSFFYDGVAPKILNLNLTELDEFIGVTPKSTLIYIDIKDVSGLSSVTAQSTSATFPGPAVCIENPLEDGLWSCGWEDITITPSLTEALEFTITAVDTKGNSITETFLKEPAQDTESPQIVKVGSKFTDADISFIGSTGTRFYAIATDTGVGIIPEGFALDLSSFGASAAQPPDNCAELDDQLSCYWDLAITLPEGESISLSLSKLHDIVGNPAEIKPVKYISDTTAPIVESMSIEGLSDAGETTFFQSLDKLRFKMTIKETNGLVVKIDGKELINDAKVTYPADHFGEDEGIAVFRDDLCTQEVEGTYECVFDTAEIRTGPLTAASLKIEVLDTAGNPATLSDLENAAGTAGTYNIDVSETDDDLQPDYWEIARQELQGDAIDTGALEKVPMRMPVSIFLKSNNNNAVAKDIRLQQCKELDPSGPTLKRSLLYGGVSAKGESNPAPIIMLEFNVNENPTFLGVSENQKTFKYSCQLRIFSALGTKTVRLPEVQDVEIEVPFSAAAKNSMESALEDRLTEAKESVFGGFFGVIGDINEALKWVALMEKIIGIIVTVDTAITAIGDAISGATTFIPPAKAGGILACATGQGSTKPSLVFVEGIQQVLQVINCNPSGYGAGKKEDDAGFDISSEAGWYGRWQKLVLDAYNLVSLRGVLGNPASSLHENMYVSFLGLCASGIVYNLNKWREIKCRQILCYANDIPKGIATLEGCDKLYDLQLCQYFLGPAFDILGMGGLSAIGKQIKSGLRSPIGLIVTAIEFGVCLAACTVGKGAVTACKVAAFFTKMLGFVDSIVSTYKQYEANDSFFNDQSPYCKQAEKIKISDVVRSGKKAQDETVDLSKKPPAPNEPTTPTQPTPTSTPVADTPTPDATVGDTQDAQ